MKLTNKGQLELFFLKLKLKKQNEILIQFIFESEWSANEIEGGVRTFLKENHYQTHYHQ